MGVLRGEGGQKGRNTEEVGEDESLAMPFVRFIIRSALGA